MESNAKRMNLVCKASTLFKAKFYLLCVYIYSYTISEQTIFHKVIMEEVTYCPFQKRFLDLQIKTCKQNPMSHIEYILITRIFFSETSHFAEYCLPNKYLFIKMECLLMPLLVCRYT